MRFTEPCLENQSQFPRLSSDPDIATPFSASQGVIEKDLVVYPDGSTLDLTDIIQRAINQ